MNKAYTEDGNFIVVIMVMVILKVVWWFVLSQSL